MKLDFKFDSVIVKFFKDPEYVSTRYIQKDLYEVRIYDTNRKLKQTFKLLNGKKEGEHRKYYDDGKTELLQYYHQDSLISPIIYYSEDGILSGLYYVNEYTHQGKNINYYKNGTIKSEWYYIDGSDSMIRINYDENGLVLDKSYGLNYFNIYEKFDREGHVIISAHINGGPESPDGKWTEYYPNGKIKLIKYFENLGEQSRTVGTWEYYDEMGNLIKTEHYE